MTEFSTVSEIADELRRLKLQMQGASIPERLALSVRYSSLMMQKVGMGRNLDSMRDRMRQAGDVAERSGVGTGGRGAKDD